jgi:DivIVA domain-containing protein
VDSEDDVFLFMLIALVAVVTAVALAVLGDGGALRDSDPDRIDDRLPANRPVLRADIDALRLPTAVRGYRMLDVDEVLDRLGAELAERDAYIAELRAALGGEQPPQRLDAAGLAPEGGFPSLAKGADGEREEQDLNAGE